MNRLIHRANANCNCKLRNNNKQETVQIRTVSCLFTALVSSSDSDVLQVIYSLNMRNEEQEAALQASSQAHHEELHRILMETCHEGEGSTLRTRLLELQESLDEQQRVGAQVCVCVCVRRRCTPTVLLMR